MAFNIPSSQQQVIDRTSTDVQQALPSTNPFFRNSFLGAVIYALSGRIYDFYLQFNILIRELFVDTASSAFLERWGTYRGVTRNAATRSTGSVTATGTVSTSIPISTQLSDADGSLFETTASAVITATSISISSMVRSGSTVTATTTSSHALGSSQVVTIAGSDQSDYNGDQTIVVTGDSTFTFTVSTTPTTPATGTITASANQVSLSVQSVEFGDDYNLDNGTQLTFGTPISGVDDTAIVQFGEVAGGTDLESDEDLRVRIIDIYQNPISHFNENDIKSKAKSIAGITRVFIYASGDAYGAAQSVSSITRNGNVATVTTAAAHSLEDCMNVTIAGADQTDYNITARILVLSTTSFCFFVENTPTTPATGTITASGGVPLGQTIVYLMRDNDDSAIPSASEISTATTDLRAIQPANTADVDFIIKAPDPVSVDFTFTALSPNTSTMQASITANLQALFKEGTTVGSDLKEFAYNSAIYQTIDSETADVITNFALSAPSGDVSVGTGEIAVLGTITYP